MKNQEKCSDCCKDVGVFNFDKRCCRERHYRMTLSVSWKLADGELSAIRRHYGNEEADHLSEIPRPAFKPRPSVGTKPPGKPAARQARPIANNQQSFMEIANSF